jgi:hypothetical protein
MCLWTSPCVSANSSVYPCVTSRVSLSVFSRHFVSWNSVHAYIHTYTYIHIFCRQFQFWLQSDKSDGNFTCRPVAFICTITRQNEYWSEECFQQYFQRKMEHFLRSSHFLCKLYSFEKSKRDLKQHNCYSLPTFRIWKCVKMWLYSIILTALYTYFSYAFFFTILLASLTSLFSYCTYISGVAKPFFLQIAYLMLKR